MPKSKPAKSSKPTAKPAKPQKAVAKARPVAKAVKLEKAASKPLKLKTSNLNGGKKVEPRPTSSIRPGTVVNIQRPPPSTIKLTPFLVISGIGSCNCAIR